MRKIRIKRSILAVLLAVALVAEIVSPFSFLGMGKRVLAAAGASAPNAIVDKDTTNKYSLSLGDNASTEYAGRVWTDKTVFSTDATFATFGGGSVTVKLNETGTLGEDFLVAFSALATAESVEGQTQAPVDVVLILDVSGSMSNAQSNMDNNKSRIFNAVQAANKAIDQLMALNPYTRVALVTFSTSASVVLPLDRYEKNTTVERVWVQTGNNFWQGYWDEETVTVDYLTLNRETASSNEAVMYVNAVNSNGNVIQRSVDVSGGTNIQVGLYEGMNVLYTAQSTVATVNGASVSRVPSVILLSDGAPTYSSDSTAWWAPADNANNGSGSGNSIQAGNGMKAIMTGAYMKEAIKDKYKVEPTVYTVGMGITELSGDQRDLAYMTLDPASQWNDNRINNDMKSDIKGYWNTYISNNNTGTPRVQVGNGSYYTITHPTTSIEVTSWNYVDDYYDADNADAVVKVFEEIVQNISITAPQVPTEIKGTDPLTSGYITYTDKLGEYMRVKDIKAIIYAGSEYTVKTKTVNGNVTTYVFTGHVDSAVYGVQEISNIVIEVTRDGNFETVTVKIPASVIPIRVNSVLLNADGTVKSHTNNGAFPARVIYSVGLDSDIRKADSNGVLYVDATKLSPEYLAANTNPDGTINFYSNYYSGKNEVNGSTAGDTTVVFEPSHTNSFYYILEDMPIYKDEACTQQVTVQEGIDDNTVYYYLDEFYHGTSVERLGIARTGLQLKRTQIATGADGFLYRAAHSPRLNRILEFEGTKELNATKTAEDFYAPTFEYAAGSTSAYDGNILVYLGNNGTFALASGGSLKVTKKVEAAEGITPPDKEFTFKLELDNFDSAYNYTVVNFDGTSAFTGTLSSGNNTFKLKDGQSATVFSLPPGASYTVTEEAVQGFTTVKTGDTGTIETNVIKEALFTNTYSVESVTFPTDGDLTGTKKLTGREWSATDRFGFFIRPYGNEPLPAGYDAQNGITVTAPDTPNGDTASFTFGKITFTAPGVYRYTIGERVPEVNEQLPGIMYSGALYRLVITVVDNGNGTLSVTETDVQALYNDNADPLFVYVDGGISVNDPAKDNIAFENKYSVDSVIRVPSAIKNYVDNSGTRPLQSGMFTFKLEAIGYTVNGGSLVPSTAIPMPADAVNGVSTTTNEGTNITFKPVTFKQTDVPENSSSITFRYKMTEVIPDVSVHGMRYDTNEYYIDVTVKVDPASDVLSVVAEYSNNQRLITFNNTYTPDPVMTDITGNKTLVGRDSLQGEAFSFMLQAKDQVTQDAINKGDVIAPYNSVDLIDLQDGVKKEFAFKDVQFNAAGTYQFEVYEVQGGYSSVKYDDTVYTVTVAVDDVNDDGKLEIVSMTCSDNKAMPEFVNEYTARYVGMSVSLDGKKQLTGKTLLQGEFYFNVSVSYNGTFKESFLVTHTADTVGRNGVYTGDITFLDRVTYDKAGVYTYTITEQIPLNKVKGTTYDESTYVYTVYIVEDPTLGHISLSHTTLMKTGTGNVNEVVFGNTYAPAPTTVTLPLIRKVIAGDRSKGLEAGEFSFTMGTNSPDGITLPLETTVTNGADGSVQFGAITFTKAGTYTVTVQEDIPANKLPGITYSTQTITATYTVIDDRNGNLTATLTSLHGGDVIVNNYVAEPKEIELTIQKGLSGRNWLPTDKFEFEVVVLDPATQDAIENGAIEFPMDSGVIQKKEITSVGQVITGKIKIHKSGTYKFIVREITGNIPGIRYDSIPREVTIVATDNSDLAAIEATVTIMRGDVRVNSLIFRNTYDASSTDLSGHDNLWVKKSFTGRPNDEWLPTDSFKFTLQADPSHNDTVSAVNNGLIVISSDELTVTDANKAHAHFGNITFKQVGTYKFIVTEVDEGKAGITYDTTPRVITVNVTDDVANGTLVATLDASSDPLEFNNTYKPNEVALKGSTFLKIEKALEGRDWFTTDSFKFTISPFGEVAENAIASGDLIMPAERTITINASSPDEDNVKTAFFGDITFKKAGGYLFVINEEIESVKGITYDSHTYFVYVEVTDNGVGQLETSVLYRGSSTFKNVYTPEKLSVTVEGKKEITGTDLVDGEFDFTIEAITQDAPMPEFITAKNFNGVISFGNIKFDKTGTFSYMIREVQGNRRGVTYDPDTVTLTVTVTYDEALGAYVADAKYSKNGSNPESSFTFNNTYKPASTTVVIGVNGEINKVLDGRELKGGEFAFELVDGTTVVASTRNFASGEIRFILENIFEAGTYTYTIREKNNGLGGVTYDDTLYTVTFVVTDDDGQLVAGEPVYKNALGTVLQDVTFKNSYKPEKTDAAITAKKVLLGRNLKDQEFTFNLYDVSGKLVSTKKNDKDGNITFDKMEYTVAGTYVYTVSEEKGNDKDMRYDATVYTVTVTVTDDGEGKLHASEPSVQKNGVASEAVFNNAFIYPDGDASQLFKIIALVLVFAGFAAITVCSKKKQDQ